MEWEMQHRERLGIPEPLWEPPERNVELLNRDDEDDDEMDETTQEAIDGRFQAESGSDDDDDDDDEDIIERFQIQNRHDNLEINRDHNEIDGGTHEAGQEPDVGSGGWLSPLASPIVQPNLPPNSPPTSTARSRSRSRSGTPATSSGRRGRDRSRGDSPERSSARRGRDRSRGISPQRSSGRRGGDRSGGEFHERSSGSPSGRRGRDGSGGESPQRSSGRRGRNRSGEEFPESSSGTRGDYPRSSRGTSRSPHIITSEPRVITNPRYLFSREINPSNIGRRETNIGFDWSPVGRRGWRGSPDNIGTSPNRGLNLWGQSGEQSNGENLDNSLSPEGSLTETPVDSSGYGNLDPDLDEEEENEFPEEEDIVYFEDRPMDKFEYRVHKHLERFQLNFVGDWYNPPSAFQPRRGDLIIAKPTPGRKQLCQPFSTGYLAVYREAPGIEEDNHYQPSKTDLLLRVGDFEVYPPPKDGKQPYYYLPFKGLQLFRYWPNEPSKWKFMGSQGQLRNGVISHPLDESPGRLLQVGMPVLLDPQIKQRDLRPRRGDVIIRREAFEPNYNHAENFWFSMVKWQRDTQFPLIQGDMLIRLFVDNDPLMTSRPYYVNNPGSYQRYSNMDFNDGGEDISYYVTEPTPLKLKHQSSSNYNPDSIMNHQSDTRWGYAELYELGQPGMGWIFWGRARLACDTPYQLYHPDIQNYEYDKGYNTDEENDYLVRYWDQGRREAISQAS
ncbi:unnamed protein product [Calypogeia fissa]